MIIGVLTVLASYLVIPLIRSAILVILPSVDESTFQKWYKNHPHHFWLLWLHRHFKGDSYYLTGISSWFAALFFSLAMLIFFFTGFKSTFQPQLIPAVISGFACYLVLDICVYLRRKYNIKAWAAKNFELLKNFIVPKEIKEAKQTSKKLFKLLKRKKHRRQFKSVRVKIQKLVDQEIPRLLANEKQLIRLIENAEAIMTKEKNNGIIEGEEQLMENSKKDLQTLQKRLADTRNKIELILCFLNHFSIRLSVLISADSTAEIQQSLFDVQHDLDQMLEADEEIEKLLVKYIQIDISDRKAAAEEVDALTENLTPPRQKAKA